MTPIFQLRNDKDIKLDEVYSLCRHIRQARCDALGRREHFVMLLETLIWMAECECLVRRADTRRARQVLHRMKEMIGLPVRGGGSHRSRSSDTSTE